MRRLLGAIIGLAIGPLAIALFGATLGFASDLGSSNGFSSRLDNAIGNFCFFGLIYSLPASILGAACGAALARGWRGLNLAWVMAVVAATACALSVAQTIIESLPRC